MMIRDVSVTGHVACPRGGAVLTVVAGDAARAARGMSGTGHRAA